MSKRALILVEGTRSNGLLYVKAAQCLGLYPITLAADPARHDYLAAGGCEEIRVDTSNFDALIRECSRLNATYTIAGITSADELVYGTVGKLCRYFDLPGPNPTSIEQCCDKFVQRQLLEHANVPIPVFRLGTNATEIESAVAEIGLPVVLKPTVGHGSIGVRLCRDANELAEHTTYLLGENHMWPSSSPRILVEEFAQGPHFSADIMGAQIVGICAVEDGPPPHFVCRGYTHPASLTDEEYKRISRVSLSCMQALNLGWGPSFVELAWTARGPVVIEVNPRLAGGANPRLVQRSCGIDLVAEHLKLVIGEGLNLRRTHSQAAGVRFLIADRNGTLDRIRGDLRAAEIPGVVEVDLYVGPKTPIVRKGDYRDRMGHVIAVSPSQTRTAAILQSAVDLISWSISPFPTRGEQ
ncbi:ATP-grasp domain-containing protein [Mesorhizobium captivum]|uniref:ATP-grasp domain-containing protein n=1 Tax=Mesorhizobium captivum TaxID=3072319 RepID=UPI002A23FDF1|nr:acetyl-CoA carboxylase biotin carboxylase subunit family protein [Mesorhizobium sp. VK22E]MDX8507293.1 acetyl-CoA carboxylase biotin carboxylase subunit family protein [Mesorhizobium sp. VK22E]